MDCLRYAHENGCLWDAETCRCAAVNGHLDCLRYAHENGCSWDELTCPIFSQKQKSGLFALCKHENCCPWDESTCMHASKKQNLDCLLYAIDNDCPGSHNYKHHLEKLINF